ncbi:hypothetical protein [Aureispira sp. CCB-E]|uniref:hypothetical protein n=1 Tax=Aureispira sp. CCB-E TaxID=3051121 RepID=UPI002868AD29|nr:hypothetical protein [Aureispira sp. CCB-E]WMX13142.1 hypothetical protein QP953_20070 [Aureispira sp. CCB-E]
MDKLAINSRNNIFYLLETLSSKQDQINFKNNTPFVHVPQELLQDWLGRFKIDQIWFKNSWSKNQLNLLKTYNTEISKFINAHFETLNDIPTILKNEIWIKLMTESSLVLEKLYKTILLDIKHKYDALFHYKKVVELLNRIPEQEETQTCLKVLSKRNIIYLNSITYNFQGFNENYNPLKDRGKMNLKMEAEGKKPLVKGFKVLYPNLENLIDENHRETCIYTNDGLFMVHSNFNYTELQGVLHSPRTIKSLQEKGFIDKELNMEKTKIGWQVKINVV